MPTLSQRCFTGGEIAPAWYGRVDTEEVQHGVATMRNFFVEKSGASANRAGTILVGVTKGAVNPATGTNYARLVPSIRDLATTYLLELGYQYIRIWKNNQPVSVVGSPAFAVGGYVLPGSVVVSGGQYWYSKAEPLNQTATTIGVSGGVLAGQSVTLTASTAIFAAPQVGNQYTLHDGAGNLVTVLLTAYTSGYLMTGTLVNALPTTLIGAATSIWSTTLAPVAGTYWYQLPTTQMEIPTPWADGDLNSLQWTQSVDRISFAHQSYLTQELNRYSDTRWTLVGFVSTPAITPPTGCQVFAGLPVSGGALAAPGSFVATGGDSGLGAASYLVTAINLSTESNVSAPSSCFGPDVAHPVSMSWGAVAGATGYAIYRQDPSVPGPNFLYNLIAVTANLNFTDSGSIVNHLRSAPGASSLTATQYNYVVTSVDAQGNESAQSAQFSCVGQTAWLTTTPIAGTPPNQLAWNPVAGAAQYNVYREAVAGGGTYGYIGTATNINGFTDYAILPDTNSQPPDVRSLYLTPGNYPATVAYFQQRYCLANTINDPQGFGFSRIASFHDFSTYFPNVSGDAIIEDVDGDRTNPIRHMLDLGELLFFTDNGIYSCQGGQGGGLTAANVNVHKENSLGCNAILRPLVIGNSAAYLQARGAIVRDIRFDLYTSGYNGNDISQHGQHLLSGYSLVSWCYSESPNSIIWAVRSDGALLGCTYVPAPLYSQQSTIIGWHRHDTAGGLFNDVVSLPQQTQADGFEDVIYVIVSRVLNGVPVRTIERMMPRLVIDPISDKFFMDCGYKYDGRNTTTTTVSLSNGSGWVWPSACTLTASTAILTGTAADVGRVYVLRDAAGDLVRFTVTAAISTTQAAGQTDAAVPAGLQSMPVATWSLAITSMALPLLAGQSVAVYADGNVLAWPDPSNGSPLLVVPAGGLLPLPAICEVVIAGLPITPDWQSLDVESTQPGQTFATREKTVQKVVLRVDNSQGLFAGEFFDSKSLEQAVANDVANEEFDNPAQYSTEYVDIEHRNSWNRSTQVCVRQLMPLPVRILSVAAVVTLGNDN